eukprot:6981843-Pyramimonas_sp.AAC.1
MQQLATLTGASTAEGFAVRTRLGIQHVPHTARVPLIAAVFKSRVPMLTASEPTQMVGGCLPWRYWCLQ